MNEGDISSPSLTKSNDGSQAAYRLIKLNKSIDQHKANIVDDFDLLKDFALANKKQKALEKWLADNIDNTYINISEEFSTCSCFNKWMK